MKLIGNILWLVFTGFWFAVCYFVLGLVLCVTIVGIPLGLQLFKFARLAFWPFGSQVNSHLLKRPILNIIWMIVCGIELCLGFLAMGLLWCVTIVGIPFGLQCFKLAKLALMPFGAEIK